MVTMMYICLLVLILAISSVNAYNIDHESLLRESESSNNARHVHPRKRRLGSTSKSGKGGKGKGGPRPTPLPTPPPTPGPTPPPTPPPTPGPTTMPSFSPTESPSARPSKAPSSAPSAEETWVSYVRLEVQTAGGEPDPTSLDAVAALTQTTYNTESENCQDPFGRRMTDAEFFSLGSVDRRKNRRRNRAIKGANRNLQNLNIFVFLKVSGRCNGCPNNRFFFNQVVGRRELQETCNIVPADAFLDTMNTNLMTGDYGTIQQADSVADTALPKGKGKGGKGSSKSYSSKGKGSSYDYDDDYYYDDDY